MKKLLKNNLWIAGAVSGVAWGYLHWKYIGCISGSCTITSKPLNSILYFSIAGGLLFSIMQPKKKFGNDDVPAKKDQTE